MEIKKGLELGARLEKYMQAYKSEQNRKQVLEKFENVWGTTLAYHFLQKYDDAISLIWALDSVNLELFITKF